MYLFKMLLTSVASDVCQSVGEKLSSEATYYVSGSSQWFFTEVHLFKLCRLKRYWPSRGVPKASLIWSSCFWKSTGGLTCPWDAAVNHSKVVYCRIGCITTIRQRWKTGKIRYKSCYSRGQRGIIQLDTLVYPKVSVLTGDSLRLQGGNSAVALHAGADVSSSVTKLGCAAV